MLRTRRDRSLGAVLVMVAVVWASGCGQLRGGDYPNVVLISIDTLRRDHCSLYGYERDTTPNLRRFADAGTSFDLAYAPITATAPSHATMFTGLYPIGHGLIKNGLTLDEQNRTLAEILSETGFDTCAILGAFPLHSMFGLSQGFSWYDDDFDPRESTWPKQKSFRGKKVTGGFDRRADFITDRAIMWLRNRVDRDRPFFLFVHYFDPHRPYKPPKKFRTRFKPSRKDAGIIDSMIGLYDAEILFTDHEIGRLLDTMTAMGLDDDTLVVITADHGEGLTDHKIMGHGVHIYEEGVRVPLIFRWPGRIPPGRVVSDPVELTDLVPTLLDLLAISGVDLPVQGQNLSPALVGEAPLNPNRPVYLHRRPFESVVYVEYLGGLKVSVPTVGEQFGIRDGDWKFIVGEQEGRRELFDLANDPKEQTNVVHKFPDTASQLALRLKDWSKRNWLQGLVTDRMSDEDRWRLRSLGYIE